MTRRFLGIAALVVAITSVFGALTADVRGQGAPATPRLADGHPDLNGLWYRRLPPVPPVQQSGGSIIVTNVPVNRVPSALNYNAGTPKYKPELVAKVKQLDQNQVKEDLTLACAPPGVPRIGPPQRIVQTPRDLAILYEDLNGNFFRMIPTDGRPFRKNIEAAAHGDSVAHWEGDTLVIVATNFTEDTWLGDNGLFHSDKLKVTERLTRNGDTLNWEATVEDPEVLVEPWKMTPRALKLMTDVEIEEAPFCSDRDLSRMQDLTHHGNTR